MSASKKPYSAVFLTLLLPGLGHWYAGRRKLAWVGFALVTLCCGLGFALAEYRVFAFTRSLFGQGTALSLLPVHLIPEALNFGETMAAWTVQPAIDAIVSRELRLPVPTEHIGLTLTAAAGLLNALLAADAGWLVASDRLGAERGLAIGGRPALTACLAWLCPGLGHAREGRPRTGLMVGGSILLLWLLGLWFSEARGVDRAQLYWWWAAQSGLGGPTVLATPLLGPLMVEHDIATMDLGVTLLSIAGLLNLASMTEVYTLAERRALEAAGIEVGVRAKEEAA